MTTSRKSRIVLLALAAAAVVVAGGLPGCWSVRPHEPTDTAERAERLVAELRAACHDPGPVEELLIERDLKNREPNVIRDDLIALGKPAVAALTKALADENAGVRLRAADALNGIGAAAKDALPALANLLKNRQELLSVRWAAACALSNLGAPAVPEIMKLLSEDDFFYRQLGARQLGKIGPAAEGAVPALRKLLNDEQEVVRDAAAEAIRKIQAPEKSEQGE